ncbi:MAG: hypothetical protein JWP02_2910 [Acidimicrobiales bacterium]|nr:hypothetical protein [Acidimicrobiales bacterium]
MRDISQALGGRRHRVRTLSAVAEPGLTVAEGGARRRTVVVGDTAAGAEVLVRGAQVRTALVVDDARVHEASAGQAALDARVGRRPRPTAARLSGGRAGQDVVLGARRLARLAAADALRLVVALDTLGATGRPARRGACGATAARGRVGTGALAAAGATRRRAGRAPARPRLGVEAGGPGRAAAWPAGSRPCGAGRGVGTERLRECRADGGAHGHADHLDDPPPARGARQ